jgi:hypothetical protein
MALLWQSAFRVEAHRVCMPPLPPTHLQLPDDPSGNQAQPRPLAGAAAPAGGVMPARTARGWGNAAPPTPTASPHAAPLHP